MNDEGARDDVLPFTVAHRNGIEYRVHGIIHGQRRVLKVGSAVLQEIRGLVEMWDDPPASGVAFERGVAGLLEVDEGFDLRYTQELFRRVGFRGVLRILLVFPLLLVAPIGLRLSRDRSTRELRRSMNDMEGLRRYRALHQQDEAPPHIATEEERRGGEGFRIAHSEAQAEAAIERAEHLGVSVMHLIVGLAHERELAYLIDAS